MGAYEHLYAFFDSPSASGSESVTTVNVAVLLSATYGDTVTLDYTVSGGTATGGGVDYVLQPGTLVFYPGETAKSISLMVVDDELAESDETIELTLSNPVNASAGAVRTYTYTIRENDVANIMCELTSSMLTTEGGGTVCFTLVLTSQPTADVTIGLSSLDPSEGTVSPATLTFTAIDWNNPQPVTVTGVDDPFADGDKTYALVTSPATSADPGYDRLDPDDASVTNTDDETPTLAVQVAAASVSENAGSRATTVTVSRNTEDNGQPLSLTLSSSDATEATMHAGPWTIPEGQSSATFQVNAVDDRSFDGTKTVTIAASATGFVSGQDTFCVTDHELQPDGKSKLAGTREAYRGNNIYNTTGTGQTRAVEASVGQQSKFLIGIQNDGTHRDTLAVLGKKSNRDFLVQYFDSSGKDITTKVIAGTYRVTLNAREAQTVRMEVTPKSGASAGAVFDGTVKLTSRGDSRRKDTVIGRVTVRAGSTNAWTGPALPELPDLAVRSLLVMPLSVEEGGQATVTVAVQNLWAFPSAAFDVTILVDGQEFMTFTAGALRPFHSRSFSAVYPTVPGQPQPHVIEAIVDPTDDVEELDETNNRATALLDVSLPEGISKPYFKAP
jgi:hypothetical protein